MDSREFAERFWSSPIVAAALLVLGALFVALGFYSLSHPPIPPNEHPAMPGTKCLFEVRAPNLVSIGGRRRIEGSLDVSLEATVPSGEVRRFEKLGYVLNEEDWKHEWEGVVAMNDRPDIYPFSLEIELPSDQELWGTTAVLHVTGDLIVPTYTGDSGPTRQATFENVPVKLVSDVRFTFEKAERNTAQDLEFYRQEVERRSAGIFAPFFFAVLSLLGGAVALGSFIVSKRRRP